MTGSLLGRLANALHISNTRPVKRGVDVILRDRAGLANAIRSLLRTLSRDLGKQLAVAAHERALFDYLTLELSPAFPGDTLIFVEISRNFEGTAVATPRVFACSEDRAIAA